MVLSQRGLRGARRDLRRVSARPHRPGPGSTRTRAALGAELRGSSEQEVELRSQIVAPDPIGPLLFLAPNPKWKMGYERERELQALVAARDAERYAAEHEAHVILAGDFDATPDAASIRFCAAVSRWTG